MERKMSEKFEQLLKCAHKENYQDNGEVLEFNELEKKEVDIQNKQFDPYLLVTYHQLLDKMKVTVIDALIEGLNVLLYRKEQPHVVDKFYGHIANARQAFNRHELSLVIQRALENFAEYKVC